MHQKDKDFAIKILYCLAILVLFVLGYQIGHKLAYEECIKYYNLKYKACICPELENPPQNNQQYLTLDQTKVLKNES